MSFSVRVVIISAKGLKDADPGTFGKSDPYCVAEVAGRPSTRFQTHVVNNCLDPVWHHEQVIDGFGIDDELIFNVWDRDHWPKQDDFLGSALLHGRAIFPRGCTKELALIDAGADAELVVRIDVLSNNAATDESSDSDSTTTSQLHVSQAHAIAATSAVPEVSDAVVEAESAPLKITVLSAKNLRGGVPFGFSKSDPYCVCEVRGMPSLRHQTRVVAGSSNPVWNEEFEMIDYPVGSPLHFSVWDKDEWPKRDDFLGGATLESREFWTPHGGSFLELLLSPADSVAAEASLEAAPILLVHVCRADVEKSTELADMMAYRPPHHVADLKRDQSPSRMGLDLPGGAPPSSIDMQASQAGQVQLRPFSTAAMTGPGRIEVIIQSAKGLRARPSGKFASYCVLEIPGKPQLREQTRAVSDTRDPVWNESFTMDYVPADSIMICLYSKGQSPRGDGMLGRATLLGRDFYPHGCETELAFFDADANEAGAMLSVAVKVLSASRPLEAPVRRSRVSACRVYAPVVETASSAVATIEVLIMRAKGLRRTDPLGFGKCDPYCVCEIPGRLNSKAQTPAIDAASDPVWNFKCALVYVPGEALQFSVWDHASWPKKADSLGRIMLPSREFYPHGCHGEFRLIGAGAALNSTITLRVSVQTSAAQGGAEVESDAAEYFSPMAWAQAAAMTDMPMALPLSRRSRERASPDGPTMGLKVLLRRAREAVDSRPLSLCATPTAMR